MKAVYKRSTVLASIVLAILCAAAPARAASEDLIPARSMAVVRVNRPYTNMKRVAESKALNRLLKDGAMPRLAGAVQKMKKKVGQVEDEYGVDVEGLLKDMLHRSATLVITGRDKGVFLLEGRSAAALEKAAEKLARLQEKRGKVKQYDTSTYGGTTIHIARRTDKKDRLYALLGRTMVAAKAKNREVLEHVIDVHRGNAPSLTDTGEFARVTELVPEDAPVVGGLYMPRALEMLRNSPRRGLPIEVLSEWLEQMRFVTFYLRADDALRMHLTVDYKGDSIPPLAKSLYPPEGSRLKILDTLPSSAAVAGAQSIDLEELWTQLHDRLQKMRPAAARRMEQGLQAAVNAMGGIRTKEQLFDELGSEMAFAVLPAGEGSAPPSAALLLRLNKTDHIPVALETLAGTAVATINKQAGGGLELAYENYRGADMSVLRGGSQAWKRVTPTLATVDKTLVLSTSARGAKQIIDAARDGGAAALDMPGTMYRAGWMDAGRMADLLDRYEDFLAAQAANRTGGSARQARGGLKRLRHLLSLIDRVNLGATYRRGRVDRVLEVLPSAKVTGGKDAS